jgi:hypothetical protein
LSHNDFGVSGFQFEAGVINFELPIHTALAGVAMVMPGLGF